MDFFPHQEFQNCVKRYRGEYKVKEFTCHDQFLCMAFAQLTYRDSLRDLVVCLGAKSDSLYHMGIRTQPTRNNLSNTNSRRNWRIYADLAMFLVARIRRLYGDTPIADLNITEAVYALDSTTIDLCLSLFPWAKFRKTKAAIKAHTMLDLHCQVPSFMFITDGKTHDVNILDIIVFEVGAYYVMDRGYVDFARLYRIHQSRAYFVTRAKANMDFLRVSSSMVDKATGLRCDQLVRLRGAKSRRLYPEPLRRIVYRDPETGKRLVFLTNIMNQPALLVARLYKCRWQIELFFKWIKQNLRILHFFGTSQNAVKTQLWIAVSVYLLVVLAHRELKSELSLAQALQILSVTPFDKVPMRQLLTQDKANNKNIGNCNQLLLNI